ncbi:MAG: hypothetical protein ABIG11_05615 [bacterium]
MTSNSLGSAELAAGTAIRAAKEVPAYREFLRGQGLLEKVLSGHFSFAGLPLTDKESYLSRAAHKNFIASSMRPGIRGGLLSSGSSGSRFCWPRQSQENSSLDLKKWLDEMFGCSGKKTLFVVSLAMEGWNAGINTARHVHLACEQSGGRHSCAFPGLDYNMAIRLISAMGRGYDMIVVFIYPTAIGHLLRTAERMGLRLPLKKMRFGVTGDPFSEKFRENLDRTCGIAWPEVSMAGYSYSSADTRIIGTETRPAIAFRRLLAASASLQRASGISSCVPNIYSLVPHEELQLVENIEGELVFTRWQTAPLIRYNLHDRGLLWEYRETLKTIKEAELAADAAVYVRTLETGDSSRGLIGVYGRSNSEYFFGMYLEEEILSGFLQDARISPALTGIFSVERKDIDGRERLVWEVETRCHEKGLEDQIRDVLLEKAAQAFPHFKVNLEGFLGSGNSDSVFQVKTLPYPELSSLMTVSAKYRPVKRKDLRGTI